MIASLALLSLIASHQSTGRVLDNCTYADAAMAQKVWAPSDGGLPVQPLTTPLDGRQGLELPCDLRGQHTRGCWDRALNEDLTGCDRFGFWFYLEDPAKCTPWFSCYFQSESGWFGAGFTAAKGWNHIVLTKGQFGVEGKPTGWNHITAFRLSAWKKTESTTFLAVSDLHAITSDVVVIQGDKTPQTSPDYGTVESQTQLTRKLLDGLGVDAGVLTDTDVEAGALEGKRVAILPHNPDMTEREVDQVERFVKAGGRVIGFYGLPARMLRVLGLELVSWKRPDFDGQLGQIKFQTDLLEGVPRIVLQASWCANVVKPIGSGATVVGEWQSSSGIGTGIPAVVVSGAGAYMSHILISDDLLGKQRMITALLGRFDADLLEGIARHSIADTGKVGEYELYRAAAASLSGFRRKGVQAPLDLSQKLYQESLLALKSKRYFDAVDESSRAKVELEIAYCSAQSPKPNEMKAVWCHSAAGVPGLSWDQTMKGLADNGMNMLMPNMLWGGRAYYKSSLLPVDESVKTAGDRISECVAAGKKYGVQVHVWKVNWNLGNAPTEFLAMMRAAHRTQKDPEGKDIDWLCPSNPLNFELERDSMLEVVRNYAVDGIHFDYIRYPDNTGCFCEGCRERFEQQYGLRVSHWPEDVVSGEYRAKFLQFRRGNITKLVKAVSEQARKIRPGVKISAAVFADWPECRETVGQDWVQWLQNGYLDFVCPMDYTESAAEYERWMQTQTTAIAKLKPFLPGVGAWILTPDQIVRQIAIGRAHGSNGFTLFNLDAALLKDVLPKLRMGVTAARF